MKKAVLREYLKKREKAPNSEKTGLNEEKKVKISLKRTKKGE